MEQRGYYDAVDGRITRMSLMCAGASGHGRTDGLDRDTSVASMFSLRPLRLLATTAYGLPHHSAVPALDVEVAMLVARRKFGWVLGTAILIGAAVGVAAPASSTLVTDCTYNDMVGLVTVDISANGSAKVNRDGDVIEVNNVTCTDGATAATVQNTEVINIIGDTGDESAEVSLYTGRLAPGRTDEAGESDEIEIFVNLLGGANDSLDVAGSDKRDTIVAGTSGGQTRVNLNALEGDTVDYDLSVNDNVERFNIFGHGKSDTIAATGGFDTGSVLQRAIGVSGMDGSDTLTGGAGFDVLTDKTGAGDVDVLNGKGGKDELFTRDHDGLDRAFGGPGDDFCSVNPKDFARSC